MNHIKVTSYISSYISCLSTDSISLLSQGLPGPPGVAGGVGHPGNDGEPGLMGFKVCKK